MAKKIEICGRGPSERQWLYFSSQNGRTYLNRLGFCFLNPQTFGNHFSFAAIRSLLSCGGVFLLFVLLYFFSTAEHFRPPVGGIIPAFGVAVSVASLTGDSTFSKKIDFIAIYLLVLLPCISYLFYSHGFIVSPLECFVLRVSLFCCPQVFCWESLCGRTLFFISLHRLTAN